VLHARESVNVLRNVCHDVSSQANTWLAAGIL